MTNNSVLNQTGIDFISEMNEKYGEHSPNYFNEQFISVLQMNDGKIVVVQASNQGAAISSINTGECNDFYPNGGGIYKILGTKDVTETRTLESVSKRFAEKVGKDNVYSIAV
tara:strand:- start:63 stop:398 length:336 start_codon:yes stop_codon:yes gene_type:complete